MALIFSFLMGLVSIGKAKADTGNIYPIEDENKKMISTAELKKFDGSDPSLPIYLALDGKIYDVTAGGQYYLPGGPYHDLAGKDSSKILHVMGVDELIIKKYPKVGILID